MEHGVVGAFISILDAPSGQPEPLSARRPACLTVQIVKGLTVLLLLVAAALVVVNNSATGSGVAVPTILTGIGGSHPFAVTPAAVAFTGDNSGFLGGRDGSPRWDAARGAVIGLGHFHWSAWSSKEATGTGVVWRRTCWKDPCGHRFTPFAATAYASATRAGHFTHLTIRYEDGSAPDCRRLERYSTGFVWSGSAPC
jgi:hypothetical protein